MKTVIITAVGSTAAAPVMQSLKAKGYRVVGCDIYDRSWNVSAMEADEFFQARLATEGEAYTAQMLEAVARYGAAFLIPLTDPEVDALCPRKAAFAAIGCVLCTPDADVTQLCRDKQKMTLFLEGLSGCEQIPTHDAYAYQPAPEDFPLMLKPQSGRSSQGQAVVNTPAAYRSALAARTDYIVQPFLPGSVWTVDVARDHLGHCQCAARQELLRNPSGLGMTVLVAPGHPLEVVCAAIADKAGIVGVVNMEFIQHEDKFWFLEVNPRFSGGVGFSMLAGADFAQLMLACHAGEVIGSQPELRRLTLARKNEIAVTSED